MRRAAEAAELADRLDDVPSPVLVVHLHRRLRELIQIADLLAAGTPAATLVRTLKLNPYRAEMLANQARTWTLPELDAALAGLLELDATLKGHDGGGERGTQRRAADFGPHPPRQLVGAGPGLLLDDQIALDGEDAATLAQIEQLDQLGIDVELVAVFAQATRDPEAEAFASVGKSERRVEASADEAPSAARAAFAGP
jgi:hypothetical protein